MKRPGADAWMLLGLLLVFGTLTFFIAGNLPEAEETIPRRTSYSSREGGLKAAYLLLQQSNIPVGRIVREPRNWPVDAKVVLTATPFFSLGEPTPWDSSEIKAAIRWIEQGGSLILAQEEPGDLQSKLGVDVDTHLQKDATLSPAQPAFFLNGIHHVVFPENQRILKTPKSAVTLFGDRKPAVAVFQRGKGTVFVVATPAVFQNRTIGMADNAAFLIRLVEQARGSGGKVYFDEYHLGYRTEESLWTLIGKPGQFAFYELLLLAALIVYNASRRFGLPRPMPAPPRVSSEYVTSLADLYRRARATDAALEGVYLVFWRDLCRATGVPFDTPIGEVARRSVALAEPGTDREALERRVLRLLGDCEDKIAAGPKQINEPTLLRLAEEMEDLRKELQLGGHD